LPPSSISSTTPRPGKSSKPRSLKSLRPKPSSQRSTAEPLPSRPANATEPSASDVHPLLRAANATEVHPVLAKMGLTLAVLERMDADSLRPIVQRIQTLSRKLRYDGPQTDDELHLWVKQNLHVSIPRVAVCSDHVAPFTFLADLYFERTSAGLGLANRGGSKTFVVAVLHFLNSTYKPGCESMSFGATEGQGQRCYQHIEDWCFKRDEETGRRTNVVKDFIQDKPLKSHTVWKTGSRVEVVAGSENAVSGPHPAKAHADEIDMMEEAVWNQSRGMAVSLPAKGPLPTFMHSFKGVIPPQDIATSTRNSTKGRMQAILEEIEQDIKAGDMPQFDVYVWCIWETIQENPNCQNVPTEQRQARLKQLGLNPDSLCECHRVAKGVWGTDAPAPHLVGQKRRLVHVCAVWDSDDPTNERPIDGKAFHSRGWKPPVDLIRTFKRNTPGTWTLQHECREGKDENVYISNWSLGEYGIRHYEPHPLYGPIYQGVDWGTDHPACVLWFQYLTCEVPALDFNYQPIWLVPNTYVLFKEIYVAGISTETLAQRVITQEEHWRAVLQAPQWHVKGRFCDPAGAGDRLTFYNYGMKSSWPYKTRNKQRMIENVQNIVIDDRFAVDVDQCEMFCEEIEIWQKNPKTDKELDKFNHAMAAWRYALSNAEVLEGARRKAQGGNTPQDIQGGKRDRKLLVAARYATRPPVGDHQANYGNVAFTGGSQVPLDPQFTIR
jgi:hypothetical protein